MTLTCTREIPSIGIVFLIHVTQQTLPFRVRYLTDQAIIPFIVNTHVFTQSKGRSEDLLANFTNESLLRNVGHHVHFQMALADKRLLANFTNKRSVIIVPCFVHLQNGFLLKRLVAHSALIRPEIHVNGYDVTLQRVSIGVGFLAEFALRRSLA